MFWPNTSIAPSRDAMRRSLRIVRVILGLTALGAAAGAAIGLVGHAILFFMYVRTDDLARELVRAFAPWVIAGMLLRGALLGALVGPPVAWTLLRRVPIGWAAFGVAVGALVCGLGGDQLLGRQFGHAPMPIRMVWLWSALAGAVLAALVLRWLFRPGAPSGSAASAANEPLQLQSQAHLHPRASPASSRRRPAPLVG
jgi:hypothetical protein